MNIKAAAEAVAVTASAPVTLLTAGAEQTFLSVGIGLIGVWLARIVFVNRENRKENRHAPPSETLPVTGAACLIAGTIIYDQNLGISTSAFLGLGTGWTTVLLLEFFGDNILNAMRALTGRPPTMPRRASHEGDIDFGDQPDDMKELLRKIEDITSHPPRGPDYKPPSK